MKVQQGGLKRYWNVAAALLLAVATLISAFNSQAYALPVTTRSIKMSNSSGAATPTTYTVTFTPGQTATVGGVIVDFCLNNPLIGDTSCTMPVGFNLGGVSPTVANYAGMGTGWTASASQGGGSVGTQTQVLRLANATPQSFSTATPVSFDITTVTNPTADNTTFYARILTFDTSANATAQYTSTTTVRASSFANVRDSGGVALSTGKLITITARVMETLAFCVYKTTCSDDPSFTIGHGANNILDTTAIDTQTATFSLSTNAQTGATVRLKGDTLKSGTNDIDEAGNPAVTIVAGTEKFGLRISTLGSAAVVAPYTNSGTTYALDVAATTGTFGDDLATISGPVNNSVTTLTYAATASNTTAAGIYTATHQLIATGQF